MNEKVMFIRYDGQMPRIMEGKDKRPLEMYNNPDGLRVYISDDLEGVGALCSINANKYKLFRSKSFKIKRMNPTSSFQFTDLESWNYRKITVDTRSLDENGERIYKEKIEWYKHGPEEIMEPTEQNITGKKPSSEPEVYEKLRSANAKISDLTKSVEELTADKKKLTDRVNDLLARLDQPSVEHPELPVVNVIEDKSIESLPPDDNDAPVSDLPKNPPPVKGKTIGRPRKIV
jgi:hypothetical protein